ncbi:uncharacterized protein LOC111479409 isoform X3 [Cucurbita maxima]|uniref:Uncharacterized protein LOC111479409 isoform X3 n=1 Tax=Cucurbita maxima TaxID=3661 RepID=A0A6J1IXF2_CUCMA|nr:uncharacterized protein LOC111479409 isoform X3 [Cucurbita maxima]
MTGNIPEIQSRCVENDTCLADNANASAGSPKTSPEVFPSAIEFYVWSDEGINLFVDLNSSPLDWTERLKNEVYICESIYRDKCLQQNLCWFKGHKEFAKSFQWNNHPGLLKDDYLQKEAPSSSNLMTDNCMVTDQLDEANGSNQKLAGSEICTEEDNREMNLDNDMNNALRKTEISDPGSGGPSSLSTSDHQNLISEICETSTLQNSCRILNLSVDNPGSLAAGSMDMESSDIEQCPTDVSDYSLQTSTEKLERNNLSATMEISEYSQFPESLEKLLPVSHILESNGAHKRKKLPKNETRRCYSEPDRRVVRNVTKKRGLPRRSRRLILKTVSS